MAKKNSLDGEAKQDIPKQEDELMKLAEKLPKEAQQRLKDIKDKVEKLKKQALNKFDEHVMGIALLPPSQKPAQAGEQPEIDKDKINVLVLMDDSDSQKMSKQELADKLSGIVEGMAKDIDPNLAPQTLLLSELWQNCYDGKYELLQMIAMSAPVHDRGMLAAIKIAEIHKTMVLKKFERYIVSYVLAGSLIQGKATEKSDIDVFIVIDDTDVKRMTRAELKDKLRAIIIGMGIEAGDMTGIKNKLNVQVYILTDFWDSIREANPIIFTFLRDGVPFYDRGTFMPWKHLLKIGKIKPSSEAIELYMSTGDQMLKRVQFKINEIGMEDLFWAILTPSQAALMLYGVPPPTPKETPHLMRELFVKKEEMLEEKYVKILEEIITLRKSLEHGDKKELTGKEVDGHLKDCQDYLKRIEKLFSEIEKSKEQQSALEIYDNAVTIVRDVLKGEGVEKADEGDILKLFDDKLISTGRIPAKFLRSLKSIIKAKKDYDASKLTKAEVENAKKESHSFIKAVIEYMQRKRSREIERARIRFKHGEKMGELIVLEKEAFIIADLDHSDKISKSKLNSDGSLGAVQESSGEELDKALADAKIAEKVFVKPQLFDSVKKLIGKDIELMLNY